MIVTALVLHEQAGKKCALVEACDSLRPPWLVESRLMGWGLDTKLELNTGLVTKLETKVKRKVWIFFHSHITLVKNVFVFT